MRSRNTLLAALIASVVLNLALVGFVAARLGGDDRAAMRPMFNTFRGVQELPEARRDALRPMLREHFRQMRPNIRNIRAAQQQLDAALTADPFDRARLDAALAAFRHALMASQTTSHDALRDLAEALTAEERVLLHAAMSRRGRDGAHRTPPR